MARASNKVQSTLKAVLGNRPVPQPVTVLPRPKNAEPLVIKSVRQTIVEIQELDPIGFLGKLMRGEPLEVTIVNPDGTTELTYEYATVKDRRQAAQFLAGKVLPSMHVHKIVESNEEEAAPGFNDNPERAFKAIVDAAVKKQNSSGN